MLRLTQLLDQVRGEAADDQGHLVLAHVLDERVEGDDVAQPSIISLH